MTEIATKFWIDDILFVQIYWNDNGDWADVKWGEISILKIWVDALEVVF